MDAPALDTDASKLAAPPRTPAQGRPLLTSAIPIAIVAVLPLLPFINNYVIAATVRALIFITLGQAWNVVAGIGGAVSLRPGGFLGLGWFTTRNPFNTDRT